MFFEVPLLFQTYFRLLFLQSFRLNVEGLHTIETQEVLWVFGLILRMTFVQIGAAAKQFLDFLLSWKKTREFQLVVAHELFWQI